MFWHSSSGQRRINDLVPCGSYRIRGHGLPLWTDAPYMNLSPRAFGYRRYVGAVYRLTPLLLVAGMLVFHVFVNWLLHRGPCMGHYCVPRVSARARYASTLDRIPYPGDVWPSPRTCALWFTSGRYRQSSLPSSVVLRGLRSVAGPSDMASTRIRIDEVSGYTLSVLVAACLVIHILPPVPMWTPPS